METSDTKCLIFRESTPRTVEVGLAHYGGVRSGVARDLPLSHAEGRLAMLYYALIFFVVALIAAALGMRGVAGMSAEIGYVLVGVAVIFLLVSLLSGAFRGAP